MAEQEEIFLPMMLEASYHFYRHLTVEVVRVVIEMLKYRRRNGLTEEQVAEIFPDLVIEEHNYRCYVNRMGRELEQLFVYTPPFFHEKVRQQIRKVLKSMEKNIKKKNAIKILLVSNQYLSERVDNPDGGLITVYSERSKSEKIDEKLLSTSFFDEYLTIIHSMLYYFKAEVSPFLSEGDGGYRKKVEDVPAPDTLFWGAFLKPFVLDWSRFIRECLYYSKNPVKLDDKDTALKKYFVQGYKNKPVIKCLDQEDNKYRWIGSGENILPLLGQFITRLEHEDVQILRPMIEKKQLAEMFIKFFGLEEKYPDPHFLSLKILRDERKDLNVFSDIVK